MRREKGASAADSSKPKTEPFAEVRGNRARRARRRTDRDRRTTLSFSRSTTAGARSPGCAIVRDVLASLALSQTNF
jgi:hypothetical protein